MSAALGKLPLPPAAKTHIASGLPAADPRLPAIRAAAVRHREAGLRSVTGGEHYEGGHWLGSFAVYLSTGRGLQTAPAD